METITTMPHSSAGSTVRTWIMAIMILFILICIGMIHGSGAAVYTWDSHTYGVGVLAGAGATMAGVMAVGATTAGVMAAGEIMAMELMDTMVLD